MLCKRLLEPRPQLPQVPLYRKMRSQIRFAGTGLLLLSLSCWAAQNAAQTDSDDSEPKQISLAEYRQELARIDTGLKSLVDHPQAAGNLHSSIPEEWEVQTSSGNFYIDNEDVRDKLQRYENTPADRGEILPELELRVETQLQGANEFARPQDRTARRMLDAILAGREYHNVAHGQSPFQKLKEMLLQWTIRVLSRLFRAAAAHPQLSKVLLWTIIGLVTLGFVVWMYFLLRRTAREEYVYPRNGDMLLPSLKHWQQWLREARSAAERSDWREAVHLAYWSAISFLESAGAWKPDRARTPREYLRLLNDGSRREPLEALTRRFEFIWYAQQSASPQDFQFSLAQLEKIGCR